LKTKTGLCHHITEETKCTIEFEYLLLKATHINVKEKKRKKSKKQNKFHTVATVPKLNREIVETCKVDTPNTYVHDLRLSLFDTGTSIQSDGVTSETTRLCTCFPYVRLIPTLTYNWV